MNKFVNDKYFVNPDGIISNSQTREPIPVHEPIFVIRAKDKNAIATIAYYAALCNSKLHSSIVEGMNELHEFAVRNPELMKDAD